MLLACGSREDLAYADVFVTPVDPTVDGARVDVTVPMRLQSYPPEGLNLTPYDGFSIEPVDSDVSCMDPVHLYLSLFSDQVGVLFMVDPDAAPGAAGNVAGGLDFGEGIAPGGRRRGSYDGVIEMDFPCLTAPVAHEVSISWEVDRSAPLYRSVP